MKHNFISNGRRFGGLVLGLLILVAMADCGDALLAENVETNAMHNDAADPFVWLEDIHSAKAMAWVKEQNAKATGVLQADPDYQTDYNSILKVMDATDRIPLGELEHNYVFNFWQDAAHPKGIWRRTTIADYANTQPHWETLLDLDSWQWTRRRTGFGRGRILRHPCNIAWSGYPEAAAMLWWYANLIWSLLTSWRMALHFPRPSPPSLISMTTRFCSGLISVPVQ